MSVKVFRSNTVFVYEVFADGSGLFSEFSCSLVQVYESIECDRLRAVFSGLKYPQHLINTTVRSFVASKVEDPQPIPAREENPVV